jgi:hypothetical protein
VNTSLAHHSKISIGTTDFKLSSGGKDSSTMYLNQEPFNNDSHSKRNFEYHNPSIKKLEQAQHRD